MITQSHAIVVQPGCAFLLPEYFEFVPSKREVASLKVSPSYESYMYEEEDQIGPFMCFPRSYTADLTNDPRMFIGNVINKRLEAFQTIVPCRAVSQKI